MPERDWQADWERCEKITPGPWKVKYFDETDVYNKEHAGWWVVSGVTGSGLIHCGKSQGNRVIAEFIAAARGGWPTTLEKVRELDMLVGRLGTQVLEAREHIDNAYLQIDEYTMPQTAEPNRALLEQALEELRQAVQILDKAYKEVLESGA